MDQNRILKSNNKNKPRDLQIRMIKGAEVLRRATERIRYKPANEEANFNFGAFNFENRESTGSIKN